MRRLTILMVMAVVVGVLWVPTTAVADRGDKTTLCHAGTLGWELKEVGNDRALEAHLRHGDGVPGGEVPGMPGYTFNDACVPVADPVPVGFIYAVAYIDTNPTDGPYNAADVLISKLVEFNDDGVPGVGDKVITGQYPTNFDFTTLGGFTVDEHLVTSVIPLPGAACVVYASGVSEHPFKWENQPGQAEFYVEGNGDFALVLTDRFDELATDYIYTGLTGSPSGRTDFVVENNHSPGDDQFIDVELNCFGT